MARARKNWLPDLAFLRSEEAEVLALYARLAPLWVALGLVVLVQVVGQRNVQAGWSYGIIALGFAFNGVNAVLSDRFPRWKLTFVGHTLFDTGLVTLCLVLDGNRDERLWFFFVLQILTNGLVFFRIGAWMSALLASGALAALLVAFPHTGTVADWALYSGLFAALAWLGGSMSEELHRARERLKEKTRKIERIRALHENILESLPVGVLTVDDQGRVNFINPAGERILHRSAADLTGRPIARAIAPLQNFFAFGGTGADNAEAVFEVGSERRRLRKSIARLDASAAWTALLDDSAREGRLFVFEDVTELRGLEDRVRQSEKLAAVGQLAAGIAHEIRNPLASVSGSIEMLRELVSHVASDDARKLMNIAVKEIERLNDLITDFLDYVKPSAPNGESVDIVPLFEEVLELVRRGKVEKRKIDFVTRWTTARPRVIGSAEKLRQVLWNLLLNAVQAIPDAGRIELDVQVAPDGRVVLSVRDSGVGMDERTRSHLFEPFFTTKPKGTGLGLATCYKIIEAHRGDIRVTSEPGAGSQFEIFLPPGT